MSRNALVSLIVIAVVFVLVYFGFRSAGNKELDLKREPEPIATELLEPSSDSVPSGSVGEFDTLLATEANLDDPTVRAALAEAQTRIGDQQYKRLTIYELDLVRQQQFVESVKSVFDGTNNVHEVSPAWAVPVFERKCTMSKIKAITPRWDGDGYLFTVDCMESGLHDLMFNVGSLDHSLYFQFDSVQAFTVGPKQLAVAELVPAPLGID